MPEKPAGFSILMLLYNLNLLKSNDGGFIMGFVCVENEIIDINGLCDPKSLDLDKHPFWTQISIPETLIVPEQKPDIEQINSVNVSVEIVRQKVIVTPKSGCANEEGKIVTGRKLIVEGKVNQAVTYTARVPDQAVHTVHLGMPFSAFIVIPECIKIQDVNVPTLDLTFQVNACIEDVFIKSFNDREIFKNVTLLLQAVPGKTADCPEDC
jgi:hypothetical protein